MLILSALYVREGNRLKMPEKEKVSKEESVDGITRKVL